MFLVLQTDRFPSRKYYKGLLFELTTFAIETFNVHIEYKVGYGIVGTLSQIITLGILGTSLYHTYDF